MVPDSFSRSIKLNKMNISGNKVMTPAGKGAFETYIKTGTRTTRNTVTMKNEIQGVFRHETGHHIHFHAPAPLREEWNALWNEVNRSKLKREVSSYAGRKNEKEFFAECFSMFSHPKFVPGTLNNALGIDVESVILKYVNQSNIFQR